MTGYLGVDVGGTKAALRVEADDRPTDEIVIRWPAAGGVERDLALLADAVRDLRARWDGPITSVGVAMPATLDGADRVVAWPGRPSWTGLDLRAVLRDLFPAARVACADDGDLAAIAEADAAKHRDVVYIGVGTGVGGGIVLGGRPCPGPDRGSCEIGHLVVDRAGPLCDCGRRGCVQAIASGPATLRRAGWASRSDRASRAGRTDGGDVTFAELRVAWLDRQPWASSVVSESCAAVALAVVGVAELVHPGLALIGGGFAAGLPGFAATVADHTRRLARPGSPPPPVREAVLGPLSSLHGAVLLARAADREPDETR
jgi:kanosamine 6-kinase